MGICCIPLFYQNDFFDLYLTVDPEQDKVNAGIESGSIYAD
jgi:hypothetical protein